ncbi:MAG TPA: hypothetical protein VF661_01225, partial [Actinomycetales bacterium]
MTTTTNQRPATPERSEGLGLGLAQVAASALAAVSSALAASFLGVAGTIIGAGVGAVVATIGTAVYQHSLRTASDRLRDLRRTGDLTRSAASTADRTSGLTRALPAGPRDGGADVQPETVPGRDPASRTSTWWRALALVVLGIVLALGAITAAEAVIGRPVSGSSGTSGGTSIGEAFTGSGSSATTPATPAPGPTDAPTATPTEAPSATPTTSPTGPTASPTEPAASPAPSADPTV